MPLPATLIITLGETPQVVTETVWALARRDPPFIPDRIWLATTGVGRSKLAPTLVEEPAPPADAVERPYAWIEAPAGGKLADLLDVLVATGFVPMAKRESIRVRLCAPLLGDAIVDDLRTSKESAAFGNMVLELVREATGDGSGPLHVSQAGGRKTMSFYAGQVITLLGRAGDELSHVLVEPSTLEGCPDFWWPTDADNWVEHRFIKDKDGKPLRINARGDHSGGEARIDFHLVPFLLLAGRVVKSIRSGKLTFADAVAVQSAASDAGPLVLKAGKQELELAGRRLHLPHKQYALLAAWAEWSKTGRIARYVRKSADGWLSIDLQPGVLSASALYAPVRRSVAEPTILDVFLRWYADCRGEELDRDALPVPLAADIRLTESAAAIQRNISNNRDLLQSELSRLRSSLHAPFPPPIADLGGVGGDLQQDPLFTVAMPPQDIILIGYDDPMHLDIG